MQIPLDKWQNRSKEEKVEIEKLLYISHALPDVTNGEFGQLQRNDAKRWRPLTTI